MPGLRLINFVSRGIECLEALVVSVRIEGLVSSFKRPLSILYSYMGRIECLEALVESSRIECLVIGFPRW